MRVRDDGLLTLSPTDLSHFMACRYLKRPEQAPLLKFLETNGIRLVTHHASGHAYMPDLQRLARAIAPRRLVPIHSFAPERFGEFFESVEVHRDGEWWRV